MRSIFFHVFGATSFVESLSQNRIEFSRRTQLAAQPSGEWWIVDVLSTVEGEEPWDVLAIIIVAWLNGNARRTINVKTGDGREVRGKGLSCDDWIMLLSIAKEVSVFDVPQPAYLPPFGLH